MEIIIGNPKIHLKIKKANMMFKRYGGRNLQFEIIQDFDNEPIIRKKKLGLASAYCEGFKWAIKHNFDYIIQNIFIIKFNSIYYKHD